MKCKCGAECGLMKMCIECFVEVAEFHLKAERTKIGGFEAVDIREEEPMERNEVRRDDGT